MPKQMLTLLTLLMAVVITLCGCAQENKPEDINPTPTTAPTVQSQPTDPIQPSDPTEPTDDDVPADPPEDAPYMTPAQALYGASPNGYGIWSVSYGLTTTKRLCVDTQGYVAFELDGSETDVAGVYNDALLLKVNFDYYILRAVPSGEMLFDSANSDGAKILLPEHNGKEMFRNGYLMVVKPMESQVGITYEIGFLNAKGEWRQPLSADNPIIGLFGAGLTVAGLEKELSYLGEGIIGMLCTDGVYRYYNMDTNAVTTAQFPNNLSKHTLYDTLDYDVQFIHGVSEPVYMNKNYYLFYSNGKIEPFNVLWPKGLPRAEKCGEPYFDRKTKTAYFLYDYGNGILVCDSSGKIIKKQEGVELKEYNYLTANRTACRGFAADGLARILLKNGEGEVSYAVLGIDGEFLFQPVVLNDQINAVYDLDGNNIQVKPTTGSGCYAVINNDGTVCYESEYVNDFSVKNGVFHFMDDEDVYISVQIPALY